MVELSRGTRLQIMLTQEEVDALDTWRFNARMPSRASAIRELLRRGLSAEGVMVKAGRTKSQDFGVIPSEGVNGGNGLNGVATNGKGRKGRKGRD